MPFSFRTRSVLLDARTDALRFQRLENAIGQIRADIQEELDGLRARYESVSASAAFSQQALDEEGRTDLAARVQELTTSMIRYSTRIASLDRQRRFVATLEEGIAAFRHGDFRESSAKPSPPSRLSAGR